MIVERLVCVSVLWRLRVLFHHRGFTIAGGTSEFHIMLSPGRFWGFERLSRQGETGGLGGAEVCSILKAKLALSKKDHTRELGYEIRFFPVDKGTEMTPDTVAKERQGKSAVVTRGEVLVVDDEEYVRSILRGMLENMGFEAIEAIDGQQGLETFDEHREDIVACVIDLTMPGMAGMELLGKIRELNSSVPVLLVSGYSRHEVREQEAKSPYLSFLQKPFTLEQFRIAMDAQLSLAS